jgi:hypothetical protein
MDPVKLLPDFVSSRSEDPSQMSRSGSEKLTVESERVERYHLGGSQSSVRMSGARNVFSVVRHFRPPCAGWSRTAIFLRRGLPRVLPLLFRSPLL